MGLGDFFWWVTPSGRIEHRKKKELDAIDHLRQVIEGEESGLLQLDKAITITEKLLKQGKFEDAERYVIQTIAPMIKRKAILDSMGKGDWNKFKGTIIKTLNTERKALR